MIFWHVLKYNINFLNCNLMKELFVNNLKGNNMNNTGHRKRTET